MENRIEFLQSLLKALEHPEDIDPSMEIDSLGDFGDQALKLSNQAVGIELLDMRKERIQDIRRALEHSGEECEVCGAEIGERRLKAIPWATRCVRCQDKYESKKVRFVSARAVSPGKPDEMIWRPKPVASEFFGMRLESILRGQAKSVRVQRNIRINKENDK